MRRIIHWTPRVLAVVFALFLALFALDVFGEFESLSETLLALTMHLIPTLVLLIAAIVAWRWPLVGGVLFVALGLFSISYFNTYRTLITFLTISTPPIVAGLLFLWDGMQVDANEPPQRSRQA
jgi:hypothetical protein